MNALPVSAIIQLAEVASIELWKDMNNYCVNFKEPAHKIWPIPLISSGSVIASQNIRILESDTRLI